VTIGQDFWEEKHKEDSAWLTGTNFDQFLQKFRLRLEDIQNRRILEIGVGHGHCTASLGNFASELYCCDISEAGLEKVKKHANQVYQTLNIGSAPPVDLAVCHLVFVHCTDEEMLRIINGVNLAEGGRFIFQCSAYHIPSVNFCFIARACNTISGTD